MTVSAAVSATAQTSAKHTTRSARIRCLRPVPTSSSFRSRCLNRLKAALSRASGSARAARAPAIATTSGTSTKRRTGLGGSIGPPGGLASRDRGQVVRGGRVRAVDAVAYLIPVPVTELSHPRGQPLSSGRQDVHLDAGRNRRHLLVEPVPARDLERDKPHLPRSGGDAQRALDAPRVQDVDGGRAERDRAADRD